MNVLSDPRWSDALTRLPDYLGNHVRVSLTSIAIGLAISFPLALMVRKKPLLRDVALGIASIVQTVPGLALLALFYPLLLALAGLSLQWFGTSFSAFGFLPRCWRSRSTACCRCCETPSPDCRVSIRQSSRQPKASA
jgi:osmoprotectant transport system permease protein